MNEYWFGIGRGHLSKRVEQEAERMGGGLANYTDHGCSCGNNCTRGCPRNRRHWFFVPNRGEPFNSEHARRVLAACKAVATQADKALGFGSEP